MMKEHCAGIIPLVLQEGVWTTLLVKLWSGHHWSFPKGHVEPDEDSRHAAQRELLEETGLYIRRWLPTPVLYENYEIIRNGFPAPKVVDYYLAEVEGTVAILTEEIEDCRWMALEAAADVLTYPTAKEIALQAIGLLKKFNKDLA